MGSEGQAESVIRLEHDWANAVKERDIEALGRLLGEEFTLTTGRPGAEVRGRHEYVEVARSRYEVDSFEFERFDVQVYGEVAVVRSRYRQEGSMDGLDRSDTYLMTDVWVRRAGRWQAVTRHLTPLAQAAGASSVCK